MGSQNYGTGVDVFSIEYLDTNIPTGTTNTYYSDDFPNHVYSSWLDNTVNAHYLSGDGNANNVIQGVDTPIFWHYTDGGWVYDYMPTTDLTDGFFTQYGLRYNDNTNEHIISNVSELQRLIWNPYVTENTETVTLYGSNEPVSIKYYTIDFITPAFYSVDVMKKSVPTDILTNVKIMPTMLHNYNKKLVQGFINGNIQEELSYFGNLVIRYNNTYSHNSNNQERLTPVFGAMPDLVRGNNQTVWEYDVSNNYIMKFVYSSINYDDAKCYYYIANEEHLKFVLAGFGLKFRYKNVVYKPVVSNGMVVGYTDNMDEKSEWDDWHDFNDHVVPDVPPAGGGGNGDELLDMESRAQFYGSGVTTYYVNVPTAKLKTALGNWDNVATGKDVLKNLISYKLFCFPTSTFTNGMLHDFVIAGTTLKDESDNPIQSAQLTQYGAVSLPSITIPKTFNDFRDYAPYTNLSMYIPLCGWFTLPPWCMGRTISGEMYINGYTGTLKCIVRADGNVVTELGGNASIDLPFTAEAVGMKAAAVLGNLINTAGSIASIANPSAGGVANVGTAVLGTVCALNANYTESKGTMGDGSNIAGLYHVYIKISRPATIDNEGNSLVAIPTEYKRQYGLPCNKSLTLAQGDGYTQILDANITGNMTAREKQMIIDGFRRGLIL